MKNVEAIKAEAKEQIKNLLDFCDCYTYTDEGIDKWLNTWEKACAPQIETIAENSPYYDGKCKIVFPSEYPREIDPVGINVFCSWLWKFTDRNLEEAKINGFTYRAAKNLKSWYNYFKKMASYNTSDISEISEEFVNLNKNLEKYVCSDEFNSMLNKAYDACSDFEYERGVTYFHDKFYLESDMKKYNIRKIQQLSEILNYSQARTQFITDDICRLLSSNFPECKFSVGQKLSRAVNQIAKKYGINKDPDWNRAFANYADAINPLVIKKWTVISWHPMDYLTFCFGNSWSTCSTIDKKNVRHHKIHQSHSSITSYVDTDGDYAFHGESAAAALSYMFDKTSFIYYTVNGKYDGDHYEEQDKESRIVFSFSEDNTTLLQSRLYPQCNDDTDGSGYALTREIVQKVISDALGVPNLWKVRTGSEACREVCESNGVHYDDWKDSRNNKVTISWLTDKTDKPKKIRIGHSAICPNCGKEHWHQSSLNCEDCDMLY